MEDGRMEEVSPLVVEWPRRREDCAEPVRNISANSWPSLTGKGQKLDLNYISLSPNLCVMKWEFPP
jgi:hypothetical protein